MSYKLLIVPEGSVLPEDVRARLVVEPDLIKRIVAGAEEEALISVSTREVQMFVEYADLLDIELRAMIGVQGAMYSSVWNTYVSTMKRVSIDAYRAELTERNDARSEAGRAAIIAPTRVDRLRRIEESDDFGDEGHA